MKNMSLSVGMMNFPIYGKIKHVPNHQIQTWKHSLEVAIACLEEGNVLFANGSVQASGLGASARAPRKVQVILLLSRWDRIWIAELDTMQAEKECKMMAMKNL